MPIHTSWKSMAKSMAKTYCKGATKKKCKKFTDGSQVCICQKGWSVFFASINKMGAKETQPRPSKKINEAVMIWYIKRKVKKSE